MTYIDDDVLETGNQIIQIVGGVALISSIIFILGIVILCSSDLSFKGPGEKNILNEKNELEQRPLWDLDRRQKGKKRGLRIVQLSVLRRDINIQAHPRAAEEAHNTILYEPADPNSSTIRSANYLNPPYMPIALFTTPRRVCVGLGVDTLNSQGIPAEVGVSTWQVNNRYISGIECKAIYQVDVLFTDERNVPITYSGNKMFLPIY